MDELTLDHPGVAIPRDMSTVIRAMKGSRIERKSPPNEVLTNFEFRKVTAGKRRFTMVEAGYLHHTRSRFDG